MSNYQSVLKLKTAAKRLEKTFTEVAHSKMLDLVSHAFYGVKDFREAQLHLSKEVKKSSNIVKITLNEDIVDSYDANYDPLAFPRNSNNEIYINRNLIITVSPDEKEKTIYLESPGGSEDLRCLSLTFNNKSIGEFHRISRELTDS